MEGRVYVCSWSSTDTGFRVWVKRRPKVFAAGETFEIADELLSDAICAATGDGESIHEYDPQRPTSSEPPGMITRMLKVGGVAGAFAANLEEMFSAGVCPQCKLPRGERTALPLQLKKVETDKNGGFVRGLGRDHYFFAGAFLDLLSAEERSRYEWRLVQHPGRKAYYELVPPLTHPSYAVLSDAVGVRWKVSLAPQRLVGGRLEGTVESIWRCDTCGQVNTPFYRFPKDLPWRYVAQADLPRVIPSYLVVGPPRQATLCFLPERWREMLGYAGTRGMKSYPVGVVEEDLVNRTPGRELLSAVTAEVERERPLPPSSK
jgi:hypothetical protein